MHDTKFGQKELSVETTQTRMSKSFSLWFYVYAAQRGGSLHHLS